MQFEGLEVRVRRRARQRTLRIQITQDQPLLVSTNLGMSDQEILKFLAAKKSWIEKNQKILKDKPQKPKREGLSGEKWMYLGQPVELRDGLTLLKKPFAAFTDSTLTLYWPQTDWPARDLHRKKLANELILEAQKIEAEKIFRARVQIYSQQMQLFPARVRLMRARTRWGSCSSRRNLNLNLKLLGAPLAVIDSVIVHELAHLKFMNHSQDFWSLVEKHFPEYKAADLWLKKNHQLL